MKETTAYYDEYLVKKLLEAAGADTAQLEKVPHLELGRCGNCKNFEPDYVEEIDGISLIVAHEICKKWGDGCKTRENGWCFLFESWESDK